MLLLLASVSGGCIDRMVTFRVHRLLGAQVRGIDGRGFSLVARVELENPNALDAGLTDLRYASFSGTHLLGRGTMAGPVRAPARSRFVLDVPVQVRYDQLPTDLPQRVKDGTLALRTEATFHAKTRLGSRTMTLTSHGTVQVAHTLQAAIKGSFSGDAVRVNSIVPQKVGLTGMILRIDLTVQNLFSFPIKIRRASYRVKVNGRPFGDGSMEREVALAGGQSRKLSLQVEASHGNVGRGVLALLGGNPRFDVAGTMTIDPVGGVEKLPFVLQTDASVFDP